MIRLEGVKKIYPSDNGPVHALDGVSLHVEAGEFVAVRGPSGCGKSTLLSVIGGLDLPTEGKVFIDGAETTSLSTAERAALRAEKIGFVFQMFHLLPYLTVLDNVRLAANDGHESDARKTAAELLERFGLAHRITHRPAQLSTGERQRVAMARALLNRPQIILADEPTGNLDPDNAKVVLEMMADFRNDGGTVLLVTHEAHAAAYATRTISMRSGRIEESVATEQR